MKLIKEVIKEGQKQIKKKRKNEGNMEGINGGQKRSRT